MVPRKTSIKLIERAIAEKWVRQLAFYHLLKFRFNNSCIYNFRGRVNDIAGMFNVSPKTLYNHINFLRSKGLICDHSNNLKLSSIRAYLSRNKAIIYFDDSYTLWDVTCLLYAKIIERKAKRMAFRESLRKAGTTDWHKVALSGKTFRPFLSYRTIAKILNCSEFKAFIIIQNLTRLQVIKTEKQKPKLLSQNFTGLEYIEDLPGYRFNLGTALFEKIANKIDFLQFPVYLKRITIHQLKKHNINDL